MWNCFPDDILVVACLPEWRAFSRLSTLLSNRQHLSNVDCLEDKRTDHQTVLRFFYHIIVPSYELGSVVLGSFLCFLN